MATTKPTVKAQSAGLGDVAPKPAATDAGPLGAVWSQKAGGTLGTEASNNAAGGSWYRDGNGNWVQWKPSATVPNKIGPGTPVESLGGPAGSGANPQPNIFSALGFGGGGGGVPLGPLAGGTGGGGGTTGAGMPVAAYTPPPQAAQMTAQQNPYIKQLMELSLGQFNKPLDFNAERAKTREEQSLAMNEARQQAGARGGQGMWGAQQQQLANSQQRALTGQEAGFADRQTQARNALLGTMAGIGGEGTRDIASQLAAQQAQADLMQRYDAAAKDYDVRRQQVAEGAFNSRIGALTSLFGLI